MSPRAWIAVLACSSLVSGCSLVGAGIGAAVEATVPGPYDTRAPRDYLRFAPKERIMVWLANGTRVEGRYLGALTPNAQRPETYLIIDAGGEQPKLIATSEVKVLGVETTGDGWLYGGVIGLAVDVALVVVAIVTIRNMRFEVLGSGGSNCWC